MAPTLELLTPLSYHLELRDYVQERERSLWEWFATSRGGTGSDETRLELLKTTYRLDPGAHAELHAAAAQAKAGLGLDVPVTLYQSQEAAQVNAALVCLPGEAHVVFSGPILSLLDPAERLAVLGHELSHLLLWQRQGGELEVLDRLIHAVAQDPRADDAHRESARRLRLYTEIYADRGSLLVAGDLEAVVRSLVKTSTGLAQVNARSYLAQAEEIFARGEVRTEGVTHPELFVRARALRLWSEGRVDCDAQVRSMIEGTPGLETLDLCGQTRLERCTRRLLAQLLRPRWFQTDAALGHARQFFPDFQPAALKDDSFLAGWQSSDARLREYFAYVLLDFAAVDPELERLPLAAALGWASRLGIEAELDKLIARELRVRARELKKLKTRAAELLLEAEAAP
jgi:hypothetical protein